MKVNITRLPKENKCDLIIIPENRLEKSILNELYFYNPISIKIDQADNNILTIKLEKRK